MQLESYIDCLLNVSRVVIFVITVVLNLDLFIGVFVIQFLIIPLEYCQIISHSVTYEIYKKTYYQHLQRLLPLHPSKIITLHPHNEPDTSITYFYNTFIIVLRPPIKCLHVQLHACVTDIKL